MNASHLLLSELSEPLSPDLVIPVVVPAVTFGAVIAVVAITFYFRYRSQGLRQELFRSLLDKGLPIPPEFLTAKPRARYVDLRRGLVLLLSGVGLSSALLLAGDHDSRSAAGFGLFPALIGVAFLLVWKVESRARKDEANDASLHG